MINIFCIHLNRLYLFYLYKWLYFIIFCCNKSVFSLGQIHVNLNSCGSVLWNSDLVEKLSASVTEALFFWFVPLLQQLKPSFKLSLLQLSSALTVWCPKSPTFCHLALKSGTFPIKEGINNRPRSNKKEARKSQRSSYLVHIRLSVSDPANTSPCTLCLALLNLRSLAEKTFIVNDIITAHTKWRTSYWQKPGLIRPVMRSWSKHHLHSD